MNVESVLNGLLALALLSLAGACGGEERVKAHEERPIAGGPASGAPTPTSGGVAGSAEAHEPERSEMSEMSGRIEKPDAEWRRELTPEQYGVLRKAGTERPFGEVYEEFQEQGAGVYRCAGCKALLFSSSEKFDSHCGWPSFYDPADAQNVVTRPDPSGGMARTEVLCARCGGHLGHVFSGEGFDTPTDQRYCINGVALEFVPAEDEPVDAGNDG